MSLSSLNSSLENYILIELHASSFQSVSYMYCIPLNVQICISALDQNFLWRTFEPHSASLFVQTKIKRKAKKTLSDLIWVGDEGEKSTLDLSNSLGRDLFVGEV